MLTILLLPCPTLSRYKRLRPYAGADPSWRGRHPDYGSANTLFVLDNTYLELLAAEGSGWAGDRVTQHIADKGQGLMGLVFGVDEIGRLLTTPAKPGWTLAIR